MTFPVIALDGPAGSGKSTVARALARRLSATHVDTGAMYRALALKLLNRQAALDEASASELLGNTDIFVGDGSVLLDGEEVSHLIRTESVTSASSRVAELQPVRSWMVDRQRAIVDAAPGAVVEGRDIGTVVLPDADLKIYLDATPGERARRRALESGADPGKTATDIERRDERDLRRTYSPLKPAPDAVVLDTTGLSVEQVVERILEILSARARR